jgi:hypothetical protein
VDAAVVRGVGLPIVKERRDDCVESEELQDEVDTDDPGVLEVPGLLLGVYEEPSLLCCCSVSAVCSTFKVSEVKIMRLELNTNTLITQQNKAIPTVSSYFGEANIILARFT